MPQEDDDELLGNSDCDDRPAGGGLARTRKVGCRDRVSARPERGRYVFVPSNQDAACCIGLGVS